MLYFIISDNGYSVTKKNEEEYSGQKTYIRRAYMNELLSPPSDTLIGRIRSFWIDHPIETGIPIIDLQHIYFLYTLIELLDLTGVDSKYSPENVQKAFSRIIEYISEHFYLEAMLLTRLNFPELNGHLESHKKFVGFLTRRTHEQIAGDPADARELAKYLVTWFFNHIMKEDMIYVRHYSARENLLERFAEGLLSRGDIFISEIQMNLYRKVTGKDIQLQICDGKMIHDIHHMWRSFDLSLHIPLIDMQHLWFLQILVRMDRETRSSNKEMRNRVLDEGMLRAQEYATVHFSTEERLMEMFGYPGLKTHRKQHHIFANSVKTKAIEIREHGADLSQFFDSTRKMKDWLLSHIAVQDKSLLWFLKKNKEGVLEASKELIRSGEAGLKRRQITLYKRIIDLGVSQGFTNS